ncbi:unnamed protein product [Rhizoctonia solani]|uniref:Zn(2)-C6 fungal-type domain-containing protein n=1 Tax=Rhizoctonia solani TaxID=456999 RepID=A0A8H3HE54_9AGAM|nr:unnamed protein product [Rhizoctonia solani]
MASTRSATGCLVCKSKRKKCDETKPNCLRCQKSRIECPGYIFVQDPNRPNRKPRTLPAPRTMVSRPRATTLGGTHFTNTEEPDLQLQGLPPLDFDLITSEVSHSVLSSSVTAIIGTSSKAYSLGNSSTLHASTVNTANCDRMLTSPSVSPAIPMTPGQASLLAALFSLGQPPDLDQRSQLSINSIPNTSISTLLTWPRSNTKRQDNIMMHRSGDPEEAVSIMYRQPVLDRTVESNALPFVLQAYTAWLSRLALDPLKVTGIVHDVVFEHFGDGEQSRLIITLLANIGSRVGSAELVEGQCNVLISALQTAVRRRLGAIKSYPHPKTSTLIKALESIIEALTIYFYAGRINEAMTLRKEAALIVRRLCPGPPNSPIDLHSLLQHPLSCLQRYAKTDIVSSIITDMPMLLRYETVVPDSHPSNSYASIQSDGIIQWLYGIPNQLLMLLAKIKTMRQDGFKPNEEMVTSLEREIRELRPYGGSSSERFLAIMQLLVQECWRQTAYVYLYMAVCGDACDTPRVKEALKRYINLLNRTQPGRLPDEFLILTLHLMIPATLRQCDREVVKQRILEYYKRDRTNVGHGLIMRFTKDYWTRVDAEGDQFYSL